MGDEAAGGAGEDQEEQMADAKAAARDRIEGAKQQLLDLSHRIHAEPELGMEEEHACAWLSDALSAAGFAVERGGGGKIILLEQGAFAGAHAAMMVHPSPFDLVEMPIIAVDQLNVRYTGKEAHASAFPELGITAADAMVIAQTAIGLLRQHLRATDRVHGIVTKGGDAPNVVPAHTEGTWLVRAHDLDELRDVEAKVMRCFEAGALATGATLQVTPEHPPYAEMHQDPALASLYRGNAEALGRKFLELGNVERTAGSTDMGNVSLAVPSIHPSIGIDSLPAVNHQPEFTAQCITPVADKAVMDGAIAMAWTVIDAATDDQLRARLMTAGHPTT